MSDFRIKAIAKLHAEFSVPGDKSMSHRAAILGGLSNGVCTIRPERCVGEIVEKSTTEWWVQLRTRQGLVGWTNEPEKFDGKDALSGEPQN